MIDIIRMDGGDDDDDADDGGVCFKSWERRSARISSLPCGHGETKTGSPAVAVC